MVVLIFLSLGKQKDAKKNRKEIRKKEGQWPHSGNRRNRKGLKAKSTGIENVWRTNSEQRRKKQRKGASKVLRSKRIKTKLGGKKSGGARLTPFARTGKILKGKREKKKVTGQSGKEERGGGREKRVQPGELEKINQRKRAADQIDRKKKKRGEWGKKKHRASYWMHKNKIEESLSFKETHF